MQDFGRVLDEHQCGAGCRRWRHTQTVEVAPAEVGDLAAELRLLAGVRDALTARQFRMLEGDPTPRFAPGDTDVRPWDVRFESDVRAPAGPKRSWWQRVTQGSDDSWP